MSDFRSVAHLEECLGEAGWRALINSANTGKVKEFCDGLVAAGPLTTMTLGGVAYDILGFLKGDEKSVKGDVMVERVKEMSAHNGKEEREHLLKHQGDIPAALRGQVVFVFTDDHHLDDLGFVYCVCWRGDRWVTDWFWLGKDWGVNYRVLRRKPA